MFWRSRPSCESLSTLLLSVTQTFPFRPNVNPHKEPPITPFPMDLTNVPFLLKIWTHLFPPSATARRPSLFTATPQYHPPSALCRMTFWHLPSFFQSLGGCLTCRQHITSVHNTKGRVYTGDMSESANMVHVHTAHVVSSFPHSAPTGHSGTTLVDLAQYTYVMWHRKRTSSSETACRFSRVAMRGSSAREYVDAPQIYTMRSPRKRTHSIQDGCWLLKQYPCSHATTEGLSPLVSHFVIRKTTAHVASLRLSWMLVINKCSICY